MECETRLISYSEEARAQSKKIRGPGPVMNMMVPGLKKQWYITNQNKFLKWKRPRLTWDIKCVFPKPDSVEAQSQSKKTCGPGANTWNSRGPGQTKNRSKPNQIHPNPSQIAKIKLFWINHTHKETCAQTKGTVSKPNQNWNNIVAQECTPWGFWSKA